MNPEVVRVGSEELEEWRQVVSWVYARQAPEPDAYPLEAGEHRFLARVGGRPAGACTVYDYTVARGQSDLRMGGVAGVATLPEFRRSGVADSLMRNVLAAMRDDGFAVSALYGYREPFYRKFGYETCGWRYQIKCPQGRFPRVTSELPIKQIDVSGLAVLEPVYEAFIRSRSGSPMRTEEDWKHRMGKRAPMVYQVGEPAEGYLWVHLEDFWGDVNVGEVAWSTRAGYEGCLSLMGSLCSNQSSVTWNEPPDSPFLSRYLDQGITATVSRATMYRIVDVPRALSSLTAIDEVEFSMRVEDSQCPWNAGHWRVNAGPKGTSVVSGGDPDFEIEVGALTQAIMGQPSLSALAMQGVVKVNRPEALMAVSRAFSPLPVVCMEFF